MRFFFSFGICGLLGTFLINLVEYAIISHALKNRFYHSLRKKTVNVAIKALKTENPISQSYIDQKNSILLKNFEETFSTGNLTDLAAQYVNFCDESFNVYLNEKIDKANDEDIKQKLGKIRYEINSARQLKLKDADKLLRDILSVGGQSGSYDLKKMEAKLAMHMRKAEIDMAFMVILQLNIEDASSANATMAVQIMKHMETLIHEHQDSIVSPPVRLMRLLVRTEDTNVRKQMLRQKLLIGDNLLDNESLIKSTPEEQIQIVPEPRATDSPQCMHIVVEAVKKWGGADVTVDGLKDTIEDVLSQVFILLR